VDRQFAQISEQLRGIQTSLQGRSLAQDMRLERIEHALDTIAIEVERVGETQRFFSKEVIGPGVPSARTLPSPNDESR
jgi:hypothetical protein